jgi:myo-inositol 2-dehydrogenase/D-chiro-inositol 1-dehydrogenase
MMNWDDLGGSNNLTGPNRSRRDFLKTTATTSAALGAMVIPQSAHAAGDDILRVGVVGCGGRGTGAVVNALMADPQTRLVAIGEAFADRAEASLKVLKNNAEVGDRVVVDADHTFIGFDAYRQVIDCGVDVVILTTPPHFRPEHLKYAIEQGKHAFVEKPIAVDSPGVKSVVETCKLAKQKGLSVVSGLCWRYDSGVRATMEQIAEGAIGDIISIESEYNASTLWHRGDKPEWSRMEYQMRNWLYYTWLSGDHICEQAVHSLDKTAWLLGDVQPIRAMGIGGRQQRTSKQFGHIFDHHTVFYEYPNDVRVYFTCRQQDNCTNRVDELVLGTKGTARILKHRITGETKWRYRGPKPNMYLVEHQEMFQGIRNGKPINNGHYMCNSTMIAIMGRMATYTGQTLKGDQAFASEQRLGPAQYEWGDMPEPPVAIPGETKFA